MSKFYADLTERVIATFAFTFLSAVSFTDMSTLKGAAIAGAAGAASVLKGWLAQFVGDPDTASLTK
jgi:hypothetical protein